MKKFLTILGAIFLGLILIIAIFFFKTSIDTSQYEKTAIPYIQKVVPELSKWNTNLAKEYFVPAATKDTKKFELVFNYLSKLGKLQSMQKPKFISYHTNTSLDSGKNSIFLAYRVDAKYEKGDANITIILQPQEKSYKVYRFNVSSMALMK